jgi:hypothetical protein
MEKSRGQLENRRTLVTLLDDWLRRRIATATFIDQYWRLRSRILETAPETYSGRFGELLTKVEGAISFYAEEPEDPNEINEAELRVEGMKVYEELPDAMD